MKITLRNPTVLAAISLMVPASADIIYSNLQDLGIPADFTGVYLNVVSGARNYSDSSPVTGWDINPFFGGVVVLNSPDFQPVRSGTGNSATILNLAVGTGINSSSTFSTFVQGTGGEHPGSPGYGASTDHLADTNADPSKFVADQEGYLGFQLNGVGYGWMRVMFSGDSGNAVIKDWAYDNSGTSGSIVVGRVVQSAASGGAQTVTLSPGTGESFALGSALTDTGGNVNSILKTGAGTTALSATNTYSGATTVSVGQLLVTGSLGGTAVSVSGGASLGGSGTIGTLTAGSVTLAAGSTTGTRGAIDLVNGSIGTLTLAARTTTGTVLTMGDATNPSILNFEVGATADKILLGANARVSIGAGGVLLNLTSLGGLNGSTQKLIDAPAGLAAGSFGSVTLNSATGNFGGYTVALTSSATDLSLTETPIAAPTIAYWKGTNDGVWNSFTGGNANTSNFTTDSAGTTPATGKISAATDVNFNSTGAGNFASTTLGEDLTVKTLTFGGNASSTVSIGGSNTLTVVPASPTTGITVDTASGNHALSTKVALGADQTWTIGANRTLTASNQISGAFALTKAGPGTQILSGANTYSGGTTVSAGRLLVNNPGGSGTGSGAVNVSSPTAILGGTGTITPAGSNGVNVSGVLAPGASIGTLTFNLGSTTGTITMAAGSSFAFELGTPNPGIGSIGLNSSDLLGISGASATDFAFNSNTVDFLNTGSPGYYKLFDTSSDNPNTWTGLTYNTVTGLVSAGLTATNLAPGLAADFVVGTVANGGTTGDIYLQVVPEPRAEWLGFLGLAILLFRRRSIR